MWTFGFPLPRPVPPIELEKPTGKGRFNVKKPEYETAPRLHRCVCAFCLRVSWSSVFYGICNRCDALWEAH